MKSNQPSPVWPYLGILVGLFAIAVSAPRGWETLARRESIQTFLDRHPPLCSERTAVATAVTPAATVPVAEPAPVAVAPLPAATAVAASPVVASVASTLSRGASFGASLALADSHPAPDDFPSDVPAVDRLPAGDVEFDALSIGIEPLAEDSPADPPVVPSRLPRPEKLFAELQRLSAEAPTAAWATATTASLEELCSADTSNSAGSPRPIPAVLNDLRKQGRQGELLAKTVGDTRLQAQLLRAQYALMRRVEIWEVACKLPPVIPGAAAQSPAEDQAFVATLARVNQQVREQTHSAAWHDYLQLDRLADLARRQYARTSTTYILSGKPIYETADPDRRQNVELADERRQVARQVLGRLAAGNLSRDQRRYVEAAPIVAFQTGLHSWAAEVVDPQALLADLERYEQTDASTEAWRLADDCRYLSWSTDPAARRLGAVVDEHYRNANVRLAVAAPFLNRFVPQPAAQVAPFRDVIVGADVTGRSTTLTRLTVLLVPDPQRLRLGLEAHGVVTSSTAATSGPATFYNNGRSQFVVRKLFLCDAHGLNVFPAVAEAEATRSDLVSMETNYDGVPLVGSMVRNIARSQHEGLQDEARWQTEQKVANRARTQLDAEISKAVDKLKDRFNTQLWETLARLDLELQPLALSTTEDRAVLRLRLAGDEQLAAYTPRPRAPSDSLMSLQVHESALNNALERLALDGQTFTLPALFAHLREKLNRPAAVAND
ncbi:MAG TPA: hypothetical protein VGG30_09815, partial [Pirellulales bacterium]